MAKDETACAFFRDGWYDKVKELIRKEDPNDLSKRSNAEDREG